jgi:hypothetical protein
MTESERRGGRARDAHRIRAAILDAAEAAITKHGLWARVEAIANAWATITACCSGTLAISSALCRGTKRADREMSELLARVFVPLLEDETITSDANRFRAFLSTFWRCV